MLNKIFYFFLLLIQLTTKAQTVVTNVTIIDVRNNKLINHQTVLIENNVIKQITASQKTKIPIGARVVDGSNKYLMPGMVDGHVHLAGDGSLYSSPDWIDLRKYIPYEKQIEVTKLKMNEILRRYLRCGITTVIDLGSSYNFMRIRNSNLNNNFAPTIYMAGPLLTGLDFEHYITDENEDIYMYIRNAEDAKAAVQKQLPYHPDLIKILYVAYDPTGKHLEDSARKFLPSVKAIIEEAHKNKLKVVVHATQQIIAQLAVEAGCDYLAHAIDDEIVSDEFIQLLKTKNVGISLTLNVQDGYAKLFTQENQFSAYEITNSEPFAFRSLFALQDIDSNLARKQKKDYLQKKPRFAHYDSIRVANTKKMAKAGIQIVSGTDAGNIRTLHASFYLSELLTMHQAGMNNWQVIQSATINPFKTIGKENSYGSISEGKIADMILLNKNPIDNLDNLGDIALVFKNGEAISPDTLIDETPVMLVQRQLNAYNARNLEAFLECFDKDVEVYDFPNTLKFKGITELQKNYTSVFQKELNMYYQPKNLISAGNTVIAQEVIKEAGKIIEDVMVVYKINDLRINKVYYIR